MGIGRKILCTFVGASALVLGGSIYHQKVNLNFPLERVDRVKGDADRLIKLTQNSNEQVRQSALMALRETYEYHPEDRNEIVNALIYSLQNDSFFAARREAATVLHQIKVKDSRAVEQLISSLTNDTNPQVRRNAAVALGAIGGEKAVAQLNLSLEDPYDIVREKTAKALYSAGNEKSVQPLIKRIKQDKSDAVRGVSAVALGKIGGEDAIEPLLLALEDKNPRVRYCAIEGLLQNGSASRKDISEKIKQELSALSSSRPTQNVSMWASLTREKIESLERNGNEGEQLQQKVDIALLGL